MTATTGIDVRAIRTGDGPAFRALYERFQGAIIGVAYAILNDWARAEDVCQEVFVKVFQSMDRFQSGTNLKAWLLSIAHNAAIDGLRRTRREVEVPEDLPGRAPDLESRRAFQEMLAPLSSEERLVVTLKYHEDLAYKDIARITGKADGTLRNLVSGALRKLRGRLGGGGAA